MITYKDSFGNDVVEHGVCTSHPNDHDKVIFIKTGNVYEFINGVMDTDKPFMKKVGKNNDYKRTPFDELPNPMFASILLDNDNKLRWEH